VAYLATTIPTMMVACLAAVPQHPQQHPPQCRQHPYHVLPHLHLLAAAACSGKVTMMTMVGCLEEALPNRQHRHLEHHRRRHRLSRLAWREMKALVCSGPALLLPREELCLHSRPLLQHLQRLLEAVVCSGAMMTHLVEAAYSAAARHRPLHLHRCARLHQHRPRNLQEEADFSATILMMTVCIVSSPVA
jgi:hypothetical protein